MALKFKGLASNVVDDEWLNVGLHLGSLWGPLVEETLLLTHIEMHRESKVGYDIEIKTFGLSC